MGVGVIGQRASHLSSVGVRFFSGIIGALSALFLAACPPSEPPPDRLTLTPVAFADLAGWRQDDHWAAIPVLLRSCAALDSRSANEAFALGGDSAAGETPLFGSVGDWRAVCAAAADLVPGDTGRNDVAAREFFERWFGPYRAANNDDTTGLFTGYYEAELHGSGKRSARYHVPIYRRPDDLVSVNLGLFREEWRGKRIAGRIEGPTLVPFVSRSEINAGALAGQELALLWVDDPVDAFFLQVQGSGRIFLEEGGVVRVGYDGQNGHDYVSIGRELVKRGEMTLEDVSMQSIRAWLKDHPEGTKRLLEANPSYVFFREITGSDPDAGPLGAQGVPLTAGRSLAVDRAYVPLGVPVWLDASDPLVPGKPLRRLLVAQDTGGAIKGPVRGDLFWGFGAEAEEKAGPMKGDGEYYLLLPRTALSVAEAER